MADAKQDVVATKGSQRVKLNVIVNQNEDVKVKNQSQSAELDGTNPFQAQKNKEEIKKAIGREVSIKDVIEI